MNIVAMTLLVLTFHSSPGQAIQFSQGGIYHFYF